MNVLTVEWAGYTYALLALLSCDDLFLVTKR
jgi:hypothetical protein